MVPINEKNAINLRNGHNNTETVRIIQTNGRDVTGKFISYFHKDTAWKREIE